MAEPKNVKRIKNLTRKNKGTRGISVKNAKKNKKKIIKGTKNFIQDFVNNTV